MENISDASGAFSKAVRVGGKLGLHARPAAVIAREAQRFQAEITLETDGRTVDAKSILDILSLSAAHGCDLEIRAEGGDAQKAVEHLAEIIGLDIDEAQ